MTPAEAVPGPAGFQEIGVARLTWGGGLAAVAYDAAARAVAEATGGSRGRCVPESRS